VPIEISLLDRILSPLGEALLSANTIDISSVELEVNDSIYNISLIGPLTFDTDSGLLTFTPEPSWKDNIINWTLNASDTAGNPLDEPLSGSFEIDRDTLGPVARLIEPPVGFCADTSQPIVISLSDSVSSCFGDRTDPASIVESSITLVIDGENYDPTDPELEWNAISGVLTFSPEPRWLHGFVEYELSGVIDDWGNTILEPVTGYFYVDIDSLPPFASVVEPPDGFCADTSQAIVISLSDSVSSCFGDRVDPTELEESTIAITVDGLDYTLGDPELTWDSFTGTLTFAPIPRWIHSGVSYSLVDVRDKWGNVLPYSISGWFDVSIDSIGPVASLIWPESLCVDTTYYISIALYDSVSTCEGDYTDPEKIVPSTIELEVDGIPYDLSSPLLGFDNVHGKLTFTADPRWIKSPVEFELLSAEDDWGNPIETPLSGSFDAVIDFAGPEAALLSPTEAWVDTTEPIVIGLSDYVPGCAENWLDPWNIDVSSIILRVDEVDYTTSEPQLSYVPDSAQLVFTPDPPYRDLRVGYELTAAEDVWGNLLATPILGEFNARINITGAALDAFDSLYITIENVPDAAFTGNPTTRRNNLLDYVDQARNRYESGNTNGALNKLDDVLKRVDGGFEGNPDNDWIVDPDEAAGVYARLLRVYSLLLLEPLADPATVDGELVYEIAYAITELSPADFDRKPIDRTRTMLDDLEKALDRYLSGNLNSALNKLDEVIKRTDGIADGGSETNDWIVTAEGQDAVYHPLDALAGRWILSPLTSPDSWYDDEALSIAQTIIDMDWSLFDRKSLDRKRDLVDELVKTTKKLDTDNTNQALNKLEEVLKRCDGPVGRPEGNDWVVDTTTALSLWEQTMGFYGNILLIPFADVTEPLEVGCAELADSIVARTWPDFDKNPAKRKRDLIDEMEKVLDKIQSSNYTQARNKLQNNVMKRLDGFYGGSSGNDWIVTVEGQAATYPIAEELYIALGLAKRLVESERLPDEFALHQCHPNPFNPVTAIEYDLPTDCHVKLEVFDILGHRVNIIIDEEQSAGYKTALWDARCCEIPSGVYLYRLIAGDFEETKRMVLVK
ncbi:hypothetical protein DRQ36_11060, partial [bacterium]